MCRAYTAESDELATAASRRGDIMSTQRVKMDLGVILTVVID